MALQAAGHTDNVMQHLCGPADCASPLTPVQMTITCLVEPGHFRQIHSWVQQSSEGQGRLEVVSLAAIDDTDTSAAFDSATPQHLQPPTTSAAALDMAAADPRAAQ